MSEVTQAATNNTTAVESTAPPVTPAAQVTTEAPVAAATVTPPATSVEAPKVDATQTQSTATEKVVEAKTEQVPVVPEKYDLKVPEGSQLDSLALEEISAYAKEKGYTQEQAQELLMREHDAISDYNERMMDQHKVQVQKWKDEVMADKEIGGEQFNVNIEYAHRVLQKFAPPEFVKTLQDTGYGNHPLLVKTFVAIGKAMQPDKIVKSGSVANTKTHEEMLYGKQN